jgi:3'-phosphoadenosine 5'-phosphosulfate sulfotransferase (PAPS reductase)/FAD synthetase
MEKVICWWSGGITSAVACKLAIDFFGADNCRVIMIDTHNEHDDTYRFKKDCQKWYGVKIETISGIPKQYSSIQDVWRKHKSLNVATGAVCSTMLKRTVREKWQRYNKFSYQVFGFEFDKKEYNRATSLKINHPRTNPIFPLLMMGYDKEKCIQIVKEVGIEIPAAYRLGYQNNNCLKTGCVQGGIGYWQKIQREMPDVFKNMAEMEHELTKLRGSPVTMLKDQSGEAKKSGKSYVFLVKHPDYPDYKCLDDMKPMKVRPLNECNGFCGVNDLIEKNPTEMEINNDYSIL